MSGNTGERPIDKLLSGNVKLGKITFKNIDLMFIAVLWVLAFLARYRLFPIESADYYGFLELWMKDIKSAGPLKALSMEISNYTSPYMYLMSLVSGFENPLHALKYISVVFDYFASVVMFLLVYELTANVQKSTIGMAMVLLSPTVIIDGAYWCQCDIIYTSFILLALLFFFKDKSMACFIVLGIAFSFKLQTLFIIPFFIIMWLKNRTVKLVHFLFIPVMYVVMHIPAWILGRPISQWLFIYFDQSGYYPWGTLNYPNAYVLLDEGIQSNHYMDEVSGAGLFFAILALGVIAYYFYNKKIKFDNNLLITLALFMVAVILYTMPHMHDRYGFLIDLLAIVYAILRPRKMPVAVGFMTLSVLIFMPYLIAVNIFSMQTLSIALLGLICYVGYDLYKLVKENEIAESK